MNGKTRGNRRLLGAGALAVMAAAAMVTAGCDVHVHFGSSGAPGGLIPGDDQPPRSVR